MAGFASLFSFGSSSNNTELPEIYPFPVLSKDFVSIDVTNIYARILTDVLERTEGIKEEDKPLLWDNCSASESADGLVTMLSKAMCDKTDLFLVFSKALSIIVKADRDQEAQIKADYKKDGKSSAGIYITFKNYRRTDMVKLYSGLEYCSIASLSKSMNLSKAIQLKFTELRSSVGLTDSANAKSQALAIAEGLSKGKDILLDAKDEIVTATPDMTATQSSLDFIVKKQSFYLGMPVSWFGNGESTGISDTGKSNTKAIERGLRAYFFSIIKPCLDPLFDIKTTFKSENFEMIGAANETLTTFEATSNEIISLENKTEIMNKLYNLPDGSKGDKPEKIEVTPPAVPPVPPKV